MTNQYVTQIQEDTGASISTKGTWHPNRSKATERDPPLYLHIMAPTKEVLDKAIKKVEELLAIDMGSLVEDKKDKMGGRRKWPEEKMPVGLESIRNFNLRAKVVGPSVSFSRLAYFYMYALTRSVLVGIFRKIYSTRDRYSCSNQGRWFWIRRAGNRSGE